MTEAVVFLAFLLLGGAYGAVFLSGKFNILSAAMMLVLVCVGILKAPLVVVALVFGFSVVVIGSALTGEH